MDVETPPCALTTLARSLDAVADRIAAGEGLAIAALDVGGVPLGDDVAEMWAAADRLVTAVRRSHALEAAVHELFEAMSSHLRLDYLSYHFKKINDRHGHQIGDDVLRAAGAALGAGMRERDLVMRYGGEEILVAIRDADACNLLGLAERIRDRIRALAVPDGGVGTVALTTSVGVSAWASGDTVESLIGRADRALYAAKAAGRDRVVLER